MVERNYIAHVDTPGGSFKQFLKVKGTGGVLSEDVSNHPTELEEHLRKDVHPKATSVKVEPYDPEGKHKDIGVSRLSPGQIKASVKPFIGPTAGEAPAKTTTVAAKSVEDVPIPEVEEVEQPEIPASLEAEEAEQPVTLVPKKK